MAHRSCEIVKIGRNSPSEATKVCKDMLLALFSSFTTATLKQHLLHAGAAIEMIDQDLLATLLDLSKLLSKPTSSFQQTEPLPTEAPVKSGCISFKKHSRTRRSSSVPPSSNAASSTGEVAPDDSVFKTPRVASVKESEAASHENVMSSSVAERERCEDTVQVQEAQLLQNQTVVDDLALALISSANVSKRTSYSSRSHSKDEAKVILGILAVKNAIEIALKRNKILQMNLEDQNRRMKSVARTYAKNMKELRRRLEKVRDKTWELDEKHLLLEMGMHGDGNAIGWLKEKVMLEEAEKAQGLWTYANLEDMGIAELKMLHEAGIDARNRLASADEEICFVVDDIKKAMAERDRNEQHARDIWHVVEGEMSRKISDLKEKELDLLDEIRKLKENIASISRRRKERVEQLRQTRNDAERVRKIHCAKHSVLQEKNKGLVTWIRQFTKNGMQNDLPCYLSHKSWPSC